MFRDPLLALVGFVAFLALIRLVVRAAGAVISSRRSHAPGGEAHFRRVAKERLEPLLDDFVKAAADHGHRAAYVRRLEGDRAVYRLEVERYDLRREQPRPNIVFSNGEERDVSVTYGGVYPAPADHNGNDTEIGWREVDWDDLDEVLRHFAARSFRRFAA